MSTGTAAEHAEQAARRLEKARRMTARSFQLSALVFATMAGAVLTDALLDDRLAAPLVALAAVACAALLVFYIRLIRAGLAGSAPVREIAVSGVLAAGLGSLMLVDPGWLLVGPVWVSAAVVCLPSPRQVAGLSALAAAVGATYAVIAEREDAPWYMWPTMFALFAVLSVFVAAVNLLQKWLADLFLEAYAAREAQAVLAVTEERLRFARDLHDLLGHNLSLIAVKSELAIRMTDAEPDRAKAEMADVRQSARDALREVRAAVRGYRVVELDAELASVRAVLEAAGVRCTVQEPSAELPPEISGVLAWVVREGATNVLKHSDARRCTISLAVHADSVVLEMTNDGARAAEEEPGTGLTGLAERVAVLDGSLTAQRTGTGGFLLRAAIPLTVPTPVRSIA